MATMSGGQKLEAALRAMAQKVENPGTLRIGFLENARYPDGKPVAMIAAIQEFGAPARGIPPRPFFRNMISAKSGEWPNAISGLLKANGLDAAKTLAQTGSAIAGQLRQSIVDLWEPPLAESTIRRKGHSKPLIDTGVLINSIDFEVNSK